MNNNEFYEVNGCNLFIPVDLIEENKCTKELEVVATESGRITFVPTIYKFRKPPEPEKVVVPKFVTVEIPNPNINAHTVLQKTEKGLVLVTVGNTGWAEWESSKVTESEIKQDFEWAWQFAREVEIE